ncbi:MAG: NADH:flavin oxidoreductase [Hyphomonadaceae bacterium]|nr:NADH:flavin oxidoreductase [Hyphomonadaceae bacterium]
MPAGLSAAFTPVKLGPLTLRNRFIKTATNEGGAPGELPSAALKRHHVRMAEGGVGMTTVAYCAVSPDGKTFTDQLRLAPEWLPEFKAITDAVHKSGAAVSAQITHGGCFTFLPELSTGAPLSASGGFNKVGLMNGRFFKKQMNADDMRVRIGEFVQAAKLAREAGFDAVELHMGHGYLLSQFLSPAYNQRRDAYGGDAARRAKFPAEVLRAVLDAVGNDLAVTAKIGVYEGFEGGGTAEDAVVVARTLEREGVHMIMLSGGMNVEAVSQLFGSNMPAEAATQSASGIMKLATAIMKHSEPKVEFREMYFLEHSRKVRAAVKTTLTFLGGVKSAESAARAMDEGFDCIALGRALLFDPNFVNAMAANANARSGCTTCNRCIPTIYHPAGTHCPVRDKPDVELNQKSAAAA